MGQKKQRRAAFFDKHPRCAFCAGRRLAVTEDHQPGRVFFRNRAWPEGFCFPACRECNAFSANSEKIVALILHGEASSVDRSKYHSLIASLKREHPGLVERMLPRSSNEIRGILKSKGIEKPYGVSFGDIPLVKLQHSFWAEHFEIFGRKLMLAFHYQAFGEPLSVDGRTFSWIHTNVDMMADHVPEQILSIAKDVALPVRSGQSLSDQFFVRWASTTEGSTCFYTAFFHEQIIVSGISTESYSRFSESNQDRFLPPLR